MDKESELKFFKDSGHLDVSNFGLDGVTGWARLVDCYDGDSLKIIVRFKGCCFKATIRLEGIDAPELRGADSENGILARDALIKYLTGLDSTGLKSKGVQSLLTESVHLVWVKCGKNDKYGRTLGQIFKDPDDEVCASAVLINGGHARKYQ